MGLVQSLSAMRWVMLLGVLLCAGTSSARAGDEPVVAVLYFDNNTGDAGFDVLQKGFADMMITDLASVDGITVVEREKLEALLGELKLQNTDYFDKKTALKLGKGLGARYAVTGSFAAVKPKLRIDVRMIDIETGRIVVATKVTGGSDDVFELEQQLVAQFVAGMKREFEPPSRPATKVPDVDTLLDYSKGIDLADRGDLEGAEKAMGGVVKKAPTFGLARVRRDQIIKDLKDAREKRKDTISQSAIDLAKAAERYLKSNDITKIGKDEAKVYLAYRATLGAYIMRSLKEHLSPARGLKVVRRGHEKQAAALVHMYYENQLALLSELDVYAKRFTEKLPNGYEYLDTSISLPDSDERWAREANFKRSPSLDPVNLRLDIAQCLMMGRCEDGDSSSVLFGPVPAVTKPAYYKKATQLFEQALALGEKTARDTGRDWPASMILETWGEALLVHGKQDEAIAKWQKVLDDYPASGRFDYVERRIKQQLGLEHEHMVHDLERYATGIKKCGDMDLRVGLDEIVHVRMRTMGLAAIPHTIAEVEKACRGKPKLTHFWSYLYSHMAIDAASHGDCKMFDEYIERFVAEGGSTSDAGGYRRNYSKCP